MQFFFWYLINVGSKECSDRAEDHPDGRGHHGQAHQVDVVVQGVQEGGNEESEWLPESDIVKVGDLATQPHNGGHELHELHDDHKDGWLYWVLAAIIVLDGEIRNLLTNLKTDLNQSLLKESSASSFFCYHIFLGGGLPLKLQ